jgi:transcriptional regulator with GAF, ATPase, and Fis domain
LFISFKTNAMDKNKFFKEATTVICGNLQIEKALYSTLVFLRQTIPVDRMYLEHYDRSLDSMRTLAIATPAGGRSVDLLAPISVEARREASMKYHPELKSVYYFEDPYKEQLAKEMLDFHQVRATSLLILVLESGNQRLGTMAVLTEGVQKFSAEQVELLSLLKDPFAIALSNALQHREVLRLRDLLADDNRYLNRELRQQSGDEIIGINYGLRGVMQKVQQVAIMDSPVLLLGETGVGKDVIAHAIHNASSRSHGPFISVNCGAIPESLIDSELFGHEKGAFTGALSQMRGRFERAEKGTIFLDEIGELPLSAQVRFLKVLQHKVIERVGSSEPTSLDIRIIAATNRNLEEMVHKQLFREDLWFRLNVFPIWIPPLRERRMDIPALLQHFIELKSKELKLPGIPRIEPGSMDHLMAYDWPGNVRELQNIVERSLILNPAGPLSFDRLTEPQDGSLRADTGADLPLATLDEVAAKHIRYVLSSTNGKIHGNGGAAEILGINASTLRNRMNKLGIKYRKRKYS